MLLSTSLIEMSPVLIMLYQIKPIHGLIILIYICIIYVKY